MMGLILWAIQAWVLFHVAVFVVGLVGVVIVKTFRVFD
jgi:hypothetical protein